MPETQEEYLKRRLQEVAEEQSLALMRDLAQGRPMPLEEWRTRDKHARVLIEQGSRVSEAMVARMETLAGVERPQAGTVEPTRGSLCGCGLPPQERLVRCLTLWQREWLPVATRMELQHEVAVARRELDRLAGSGKDDPGKS